MRETIVVTRHPALIELLHERGLVPPRFTCGCGQEFDSFCPYCNGEEPSPSPRFENYSVLQHATPEDVRGKHVIGVLPLALAALAERVTEIPLALTPELRGKELDLATLRSVAGAPVTYRVEVVNE